MWATQKRATPSLSPPPPARSAQRSARSPRSKVAARSGSLAAPRSAATSSMNSGSMRRSTNKSEDVRKTLRTHCPTGVNVYFDNVGGDILDIALTQLARHARVVVCGAISQYNNTTPIKGPSNYLSLLVNRARIEGMVVFDYASRYAQAVSAIAAWIAAGKLKSREDIVEGLETFPETLLKLFSGENFGKLVLKIADA